MASNIDGLNPYTKTTNGPKERDFIYRLDHLEEMFLSQMEIMKRIHLLCMDICK